MCKTTSNKKQDKAKKTKHKITKEYVGWEFQHSLSISVLTSQTVKYIVTV
jgi:hypothetical protein